MQPLSQWPTHQRSAITGLVTDIDDTLTTHGQLTPDARQALHDLRDAGVLVIPITGRPIGWCEPLMSGAPSAPAWPVDAMVAENGALAWARARQDILHKNGLQPLRYNNSKLLKLYQQSSDERYQQGQRLRAAQLHVMQAVPEIGPSQDSAGRETDLAFDVNEFVHLSPATVARARAVLQDQGLHTHLSSIHLHGSLNCFDKWQGACWIVRTLWQRDLAQERDHWVCVGDSGNDQALFEHFHHSVGVANIGQCAASLTHLPRYVTPDARGAGFAQLARAIVQARAA
ncbi:MAG: HAD-IIB family hydrolase [Comamonadaceae bacterium]|nr:HAD-IIB family hydrolase [Comamonadaceae bacterium]